MCRIKCIKDFLFLFLNRERETKLLGVKPENRLLVAMTAKSFSARRERAARPYLASESGQNHLRQQLSFPVEPPSPCRVWEHAVGSVCCSLRSD